MTDLQSCYDYKLANIGRMIEESVGHGYEVNSQGNTKIEAPCKHRVRHKFRFLQRKGMPIRRTGQGNRFSGDMCRDISCLMLKVLEKKRL